MNPSDTNKSAPLVSVIVVNYNCKKWLGQFFPSLRVQTIFDRMEVILVDNTSQDGSAEICEREMAGWPDGNGVFLPTGGNYGFGGGSNCGAKIARGKYLFFVNPDVRLEPDCLAELVRCADETGSKVSCPLELNYDSDQVHGQGADGFDIFGCMTSSPLGKNVRQTPVFAVATFFFIERDFFHQIGGFDDEFFLFNEEMDLSWRTWIAGESVTLFPSAKIHHQFASNGDRKVGNRTNEAKRFYANRSQLLTILKNSHWLLFILAFTYLALITAETLAGALLSRRLSFIRWSLWQPVANCWRLRQHILSQRRMIGRYRRRGDGWIAIRFFRFKFGHWKDIQRFLKSGGVIDKSSVVVR